MDFEFFFPLLAAMAAFECLWILFGLLRKSRGRGGFTWHRTACESAALVFACLAAALFLPRIERVSSGPDMTHGMLALVMLVAYVGMRFILGRLWRR